MKTLALLFLVFVVLGFTRADRKNVETLKGNWNTIVDDAYEASKNSNKPILVLFTGSDWCKPCQALEKNLFSTDEFEEWAEDKVVLLYLDNPIKTQMPKEHWVNIRKVSRKVPPNGFPSVVIFDAERESDTSYTYTEWGRVSGYDDNESFMKELNAIMDK